MARLSTEVSRTVESWGPEAAQALKRARNKDRFRSAVLAAWRTRPEVAQFILAHVNAIYVAEDPRPRKGPDKDRPWWVLGVYLDEPLARAELDAWQSVLFQCLRREGFAIDELRFFPAKWDMRARKLFAEDEAVTVGASPEPVRFAEEVAALDTVKRAVCLAFEDDEGAWALLEQVRGAAVREVPPTGAADEEPTDRRSGTRRFRLFLYVDDREEVRRVMAHVGRTVRSKAWSLGLPLASIWVRQAPASLSGQCAFRRVGPSVPLRDASLGDLAPSQGAGSAQT